MYGTHLELAENRMVLDTREQHSHSVSAIVQVRDPSSVQVTRQLVNICLQLCESWGWKENI